MNPAFCSEHCTNLQSKHRLFKFDKYRNYRIAELGEFCHQNQILTLCMPAYSSHVLKPLDVSCFAPLKQAFGHQILSKIRLRNIHLTKSKFFPAFYIAHKQAMTAEIILAGFVATRLILFNPEKILQKLDIMI